MMTRCAAVAAVCASLAGAGACAPDLPTGPTGPGVTSVTQIFSGTVAPGATAVTDFTIPAVQLLRITLGTLTNAAGSPLGTPVTLRLGIRTSADGPCSTLMSSAAVSRLTAHLTATASAAAYCVVIEDTAALPETAKYTLRITYGTFSTTQTSGTIPHTSNVIPGGSTSRTFTASADGSISVTLEAIAPASVPSLGVGIGYARGDGGGCEMSTSIVATRGAVLTVPVDAGAYCVKVFDPGTLAEPAAFTVRIAHP
jgi:hypothetical protein